MVQGNKVNILTHLVAPHSGEIGDNLTLRDGNCRKNCATLVKDFLEDEEIARMGYTITFCRHESNRTTLGHA